MNENRGEKEDKCGEIELGRHCEGESKETFKVFLRREKTSHYFVTAST